ncbi:uncharacterized protein LOC134280272 isoform X2 [Saccostrea cucullata]|uniref:uncharacterized protein LOC134280272 isoform X2 n=1 Tax=Saccostrea cuccullata TaxID=36930 RepID=UPI002ED6AC8C
MIICSVLFSHVFFRFSAISIPVREMVRDRLVCLLYSTKEQDIGTYQEIGEGQTFSLSYTNNERNIETRQEIGEGQTCSFALIYQGPGHRNMSAVMKFNRLRLGYIYQTYRVVL